MITKIILLFFIISNASAAILELKPDQSKVEFLAVGKPSFLKIKGTTKELNAILEISEQKTITGTLKVPLDKLETGIELRDEHMKENYLKTNDFPYATLSLKELPLELEGEIEANLELHGITKVVKVEISKENLKRKATFKINIEDFNISIPSYQGITVAKEVIVTTELEFLNP